MKDNKTEFEKFIREKLGNDDAEAALGILRDEAVSLQQVC
jgi:hypothetical protein